MSRLFSPTALGPLELQNHVVMAPLTRCRAVGGIPNDLMVQYYGQRAAAGLIITEGTTPSPNGLGYARIPGIYSDEQVAGWRKVTDAVHAQGGKIFVQLMHCGRIAHPLNLPKGATILAPSAIAAVGELYTDTEGMKPNAMPVAMTIAQVRSTIAEYAKAAQRALDAGFDGVELHGANGYLVEQFLRPSSNVRADQYGGTIENRARFALEIVDAMIATIGRARIGIRLSPHGVFNDMPNYPEMDADYQYLAEQLNLKGIAYVHLVDHSAMGAPVVPDSIKKVFRQTFSGRLILSGGYDAARAEEDLVSGRCDLIAFGRPFIANPDLVVRLQAKAALNTPNDATFYTPGATGYTDYPALV